jgi:hypothetical protein
MGGGALTERKKNFFLDRGSIVAEGVEHQRLTQ